MDGLRAWDEPGALSGLLNPARVSQQSPKTSVRDAIEQAQQHLSDSAIAGWLEGPKQVFDFQAQDLEGQDTKMLHVV